MTSDSLHIGVLQMECHWMDRTTNINYVANHLAKLTATPDLLVLPEMWTTGFVMQPQEAAVHIADQSISHLQSIASTYDTAILGSQAIVDGDSYYNRVLLTTAQGTTAVYDKQYLFTPAGESQSYQAGTAIATIDFRGWSIRPQVCYDLRFAESVRDADQPDLIIYMANWPTARIYHWEQLLIARAIENQCPVVGCNRVGTDNNGWDYNGKSAIIDHMGHSIDTVPVGSGYISATLLRSAAEQYRSKMPFHKDKKSAV